jgi:hypothetical protein
MAYVIQDMLLRRLKLMHSIPREVEEFNDGMEHPMLKSIPIPNLVPSLTIADFKANVAKLKRLAKNDPEYEEIVDMIAEMINDPNLTDAYMASTYAQI